MKTTTFLITLLSIGTLLSAEYEREVKITPLYVATAKGDIAEMRRLVASGTNVNEKNYAESINFPGTGMWDYEEAERTPLFAAIEAGNVEATELLLKHGADTNAEGNHYNGGRHPLVSTSYIKDTTARMVIFDQLIKHGAHKGFDAVIVQHAYYRLSELPQLLAYRKELVAKGLLADDPHLLSKALYHGIYSQISSRHSLIDAETFITTLVDLGADVNWDKGAADDKFSNNDSPLLVAVQGALDGMHTYQLIRVLLKHGANPRQKGWSGKSAIDLAKKASHQKLVDLLGR